MNAVQRCPESDLIASAQRVARDDSAGLLAGVDRFGAGASLLCAVHCASWPLMLGLLPALGMSFLGSELLERGFVVLATALALSSLIAGWRRHRRFSALGLLAPGLALIWFGSFGPYHHLLVPHAVLMTLGGLLVASSHLLNLQLGRRHVHGPACKH